MAGTIAGAAKAKKKILEKNPDFYVENGRKGGLKSKGGGFQSFKVGDDGMTGYQRARVAGRMGGLKSKRGKRDVSNS